MVTLMSCQQKSHCCYSKINRKGFSQLFSINQLAIACASTEHCWMINSQLQATPACTYLKLTKTTFSDLYLPTIYRGQLKIHIKPNIANMNKKKAVTLYTVLCSFVGFETYFIILYLYKPGSNFSTSLLFNLHLLSKQQQ